MNFYAAALFTVIAGISTGVGGFTLTRKNENEIIVSVSLGFAAGVMLCLSLIGFLGEAKELLVTETGESIGAVLTVCFFFSGVAVAACLDAVVCYVCGIFDKLCKLQEKRPRNMKQVRSGMQHVNGAPSVGMKAGVVTSVAVAMHNIPEGIAMFLTALDSAKLAVPLFIAVALHNIPVGMAIGVPVYHASGSRLKSTMYAAGTGLVQPISAILGYLLFMPFLNNYIFGILYAVSAGLMLFVVFDDLIPAAYNNKNHRYATVGVVVGVSAMSLIMLFAE